MKNILVPIGESANATNTLQYAIDFAKAMGANVFVFRAFKVLSKAGTILNVDEIVNFIKAFSKPYNGAFTFLKGKKIRIFNAEKIKLKENFHPFQNGIIFRHYNFFIYIASGKYAIKISLSDTVGLDKKISQYLGKKFLNE